MAADDPRPAAPPSAVEGDAHGDDWKYDLALRPRSFAEFVGQRRVVENISIAIAGARRTGELLGHVLLSGPPGLGKTTLAMLLADELGVPLRATSARSFDKQADLVGILTSLERSTVFFIDEIHALKRGIEEYLHSAMTDFSVDIVLDSGPHARSIHLPLQPFVLVGATTREGLLSGPFHSRFVIRERLDFYEPEDLRTIITRSATLLQTPIGDDAALALARCSRGTPRTANRLLRLARYLALAEDRPLSTDLIARALANNGVDERGLAEMDRRVLRAIAQAGGQPVGLKTIAEIVEEETGTLEARYEPFLLQQGLLLKTPRGRQLTKLGWEVAERDPPPGAAAPLFG